MPDTVVGLFRTRSEAEAGLGKLKEAGFGPDQLSVSTPAGAMEAEPVEAPLESGRPRPESG